MSVRAVHSDRGIYRTKFLTSPRCFAPTAPLILLVLLVALVISISAIAATNKTAAVTHAKGGGHNVIAIQGLHIAIPNDTKTFPADLVPLP
jgi:hypothetical protein